MISLKGFVSRISHLLHFVFILKLRDEEQEFPKRIGWSVGFRRTRVFSWVGAFSTDGTFSPSNHRNRESEGPDARGFWCFLTACQRNPEVEKPELYSEAHRLQT